MIQGEEKKTSQETEISNVLLLCASVRTVGVRN